MIFNTVDTNMQGYGERVSSPCRPQFNALLSVLTRELMLSYQKIFTSRPVDWFLSFTNIGGWCKNGTHAQAECHFYASSLSFWIFSPPLVIRGELVKVVSLLLLLLSLVTPLFNAACSRFTALFCALFNALTQHIQITLNSSRGSYE
jgi:hypothetical protein